MGRLVGCVALKRHPREGTNYSSKQNNYYIIGTNDNLQLHNLNIFATCSSYTEITFCKTLQLRPIIYASIT